MTDNSTTITAEVRAALHVFTHQSEHTQAEVAAAIDVLGAAGMLALIAAVYLRMSDDRTGEQLGVARQREDCLALCERKGWTPVEYLDPDISAATGKPRPAYERMLTDIRDGEIGAVVCWHLDRLHRRPIELEAFMSLADEKRVKLATVTGDVDLSTDDGQFMARIMGAVARKEVDRKHARQLRAMRQLAENGVPNWSRAFGYDADRQPDPKIKPLVEQAYAAILAGSSLRDVCAIFNDADALTVNGKRWEPTTMSRFLRRPMLAGLRAYGHRSGPATRDAIVGRGSWEPLIPEATFWAAQAVLDAPGRAPGRKSVRKHLLTGVLVCGRCGGYMSGANIDHKLTYRCKACFLTVRAAYVEPVIYEIVGGRLAAPDAQDLLKAEIHDEAEAEAIRAELATLYARLDAIGVSVGLGDLTGKQAKLATEVVNDQIAALERKQQDAERLRVFADIPLGTPEAVAAVNRLTPDRFRAVLAVLATVTIAPVGKGGRTFNPERVRVGWH